MLTDNGDIVKALGYLALYAAYTEEAIDECISTLIKHDPKPPKNLQKYPCSQKIEYINQRIKLKPLTQELQHFPQLLEYLIDLFEERNQIIHGRIYGSLQGKADILRPGRPSGSEREITSSELIDLANQFFDTLNPLNQAAFHSFNRYLK
jgi:hypothetical protein